MPFQAIQAQVESTYYNILISHMSKLKIQSLNYLSTVGKSFMEKMWLREHLDVSQSTI